jgi:alpha-galactosidase
LTLLARSGTPLFVSADPQTLGGEQKAALTSAYDYASRKQPPAQPLDWFDTVCPTRWELGGEEVSFDWFA